VRSAKLQAFMDSRFAATEKAIARCEHVGTVRVYIPASDANATPERLTYDAGSFESQRKGFEKEKRRRDWSHRRLSLIA
jgi:hypothetical protein